MIFSGVRNFFAPAPHIQRLPDDQVKRQYPKYRWSMLESTFIGYAALQQGLSTGRVILLPLPEYLRDLVDNCEFDTIYHEHLCYFSVTAADRLFRRHGLFLTNIERLPIHGGSIRLYVEPLEDVKESGVSILEQEKIISEAGNPLYRHPTGFHDDRFWALGLAVDQAAPYVLGKPMPSIADAERQRSFSELADEAIMKDI